jgi:hypothetical protein
MTVSRGLLSASVALLMVGVFAGRLGPPFDPNCGLVGAWKVSPWIGDYQGICSGGGRVYAAWTDAGSGRPEIAVAGVSTRDQ